MNSNVQTAIREIGQEIARARQQLGKSIDEIAHATRINPKYLEFMEQGNFDFLPRPYVKAFLKTYANTLNLDGEAFVERWQEAERMATTEPARGEMGRQSIQEPASGAHVAPSKIVSAGRSIGQVITSKYFKETLAGIGLVAALLVLMIIFADQGENDVQPPQKMQTQVSETLLPETKVPEIPFEQVLAENEARVQASVPPQQVADVPEPEQEKIKLTLIATDHVWVKIILDGVEESEHIFKAGNRMSWEATESFSLHIGNAGGVKLELNGKALGPIGESGDVARLQLTRQGVQSRRISKPPRNNRRSSTDGAVSTTVDTTVNRNN